MMAVSIRGMCLLLTAVPHFNFRSNMIELLVPRMNDRENEKLADHCCTTVKSLFAHDKQYVPPSPRPSFTDAVPVHYNVRCESLTTPWQNPIYFRFDATQETVKAMSRVIRASNYRVRSEMLRCFFDLKLSAAAIKSYQQQQLKDRAADAADSKEAAKVKPGKGGKHKSRMKKRVNKAHKELDKELRDAQLEVDTQALARRQTAILNQVFATLVLT
jgi:nucleolar complex protein 3